ncbi:hypothetical protein O6H91_16G019800 [Diphasiastrum complanatum]|uniref:Uncharacterized protein n=1 Tax=Diphasiastrum complanatum TaxID=34168 RepID=A0ACC2BAG1_DIPCM|nr:hypothetical protein O6H91_Y023300 [Diphasiastrum complanatum]KAJ7526720.1 hypothetical protein O6H91_16G019800 [Diphasiastrum complanatum]
MVDNIVAQSENSSLRQRHGSTVSSANGSKPGSAEEIDFGLDSYVDDNSFLAIVIGVSKVVLCLLVLAINTSLWFVVLLLLLPWPNARLYQGNLYGRVSGRMLMWICGNPLTIRGQEYANDKAIYIANHSSIMDVPLMLWLTPLRTVGIGKKEVIWFPFFGILFMMAGHLRIDRSNRESSHASMTEVAKEIVENDLSLGMFPEGTRSSDGRLLPFKKGFIHLALQTKRPIVPVVLTGTYLGWPKHSFHVRPAPVSVTFLPPIKTDDWTIDKVNNYTEMIHDIYVKHLPERQRPLEMSPTKEGLSIN